MNAGRMRNFWRERKEVLSLWPTGKEIDLTEATDYLRSLPPGKNYALEIVKAKKEGRTLVQPRGGVALVEDHIALLQCLQDQGGADLLPNTRIPIPATLNFRRPSGESKRAGGRAAPC